MSYGTVNELKSMYKILGEQFSDNDLQDELDRAHRKLDGRVGRQFFQTVRARIDDQEDFQLAFTELESFTDAQLLGDDELIDASNYTATTSTGTISFTTSWAEDNVAAGTVIRFKYVPTVYKDLELWYAIQGLARRNSLQTRDGQTSINTEEAAEHIDELESMIDSKVGNRLVLDHNPRFPVDHSWS